MTSRVRLKRLCAGPPQYGANVPAAEYETEGVRFIRTSDITASGQLRDDSGVFVDPSAVKDHLLRPGDLLLSRSGTLGRALLWTTDEPAAFAGYLVRFAPDPCRADPRFLWYLTQTSEFQQQVEIDATQATISNFNARRYADLTVPKPPSLSDQRGIADFLDIETERLTQVVQAKERLLNLLTVKRATLYSAAAAGQLGVSHPRSARPNLPWLSAIPDHWQVAKLSLVAELGTGHTPSRAESAYWDTDREIAWLTTGDIERFRDDRLNVLSETKEQISRIGLENSAAVLHPKGTVALSRTASVGFSVVMGVDMATSQDFVTWTCSELVEPLFLLICLRAMRTDLVGRLAMGSTHKTIYMPDIESLRIPLPPVHEQRELVDLVEKETARLDDVARRLHMQLPLFGERRNALITAAVSGQVDPSSYRESAVTA